MTYAEMFCEIFQKIRPSGSYYPFEGFCDQKTFLDACYLATFSSDSSKWFRGQETFEFDDGSKLLVSGNWSGLTSCEVVE